MLRVCVVTHAYISSWRSWEGRESESRLILEFLERLELGSRNFAFQVFAYKFVCFVFIFSFLELGFSGFLWFWLCSNLYLGQVLSWNFLFIDSAGVKGSLFSFCSFDFLELFGCRRSRKLSFGIQNEDLSVSPGWLRFRLLIKVFLFLELFTHVNCFMDSVWLNYIFRLKCYFYPYIICIFYLVWFYYKHAWRGNPPP